MVQLPQVPVPVPESQVPLQVPSTTSASNNCIAVRKVATPLRELTCHSVTCQPAEVTLPPLPQPKLVLD